MYLNNGDEEKHNSDSPFQIFIVDRYPMMLQGYRAMIHENPALNVCGEASVVSEALTKIALLKPDLIVTSINLEDSNGLELTTMIRAHYPFMRILVVSHQESDFYTSRALEAGADAYLERTELIEKGVEVMLGLLTTPDKS